MRDKGIVGGAAVCAIFGVAALCLAAHMMEPTRIEISFIEPGEYVACEGIAYQVIHSEPHWFVRIFDGAAVDVPFFNYDGEISVGDLVYVEGTVTVYHGHLEIIPKTYRISKVLYGMCSESKLRTAKGVFHVELEEGVQAVVGAVNGDNLEIQKRLPEDLFVKFQGRIHSYNTEESTFQIFGNSATFSLKHPVEIGEISGIGIGIEERVVVLYHQWNELPINTVAEAKQNPKGYPIRVCGTIKSVWTSKGHIFLLIADSTGHVLIPVFKDMQNTLRVNAEDFCEGQKITVTGITHVYEGIFEILPEVIA
jgi:DNA/RNA endonuclease YhcR with UshA esterase domain